MERPNQPPNTEGCSGRQEPVDLHYFRLKKPPRSVPPAKSGPQAGVASGLSNSASKTLNADGDDVVVSEPKIEGTAKGEGTESLPGSKSVAHSEGSARNWGVPEGSCRTNCESQAGQAVQRQEGQPQDHTQGIGLAHSTWPQSQSSEAREGANTVTQPTQETGPERKSEADWQTFLRAIANKARHQPQYRFRDLYRQLNPEVLRLCFFQLRKDAASGVDGVTFQEYERDLERNLEDLVERLKNKSYRARLVRRKFIPKPGGKRRGLGIPVLEDKLLQVAAAQLLLAIYEQDFLPCSYGYRVGLGPHDAIRALTTELQFGSHHFIHEADVKGFFDNVRHEWMVRMVEQRVEDQAFIRLIKKWLKAGILEEDGKVSHPLTGTPQGGVISPVLANIYLHYALDLWFEKKFKPRQRGSCYLIRYADDFVTAFSYRNEAEAFEKELKERLAKFGLELAADKTKTLRFGRNGGEHNGRFDFLGFEFYWEPDRKGRPRIKRRTASKKLRASLQRMREWIRTNRHQKAGRLMQRLRAKLSGTWNYYGLIGNFKAMNTLYQETCRVVFKWLNRRSQRKSVTWCAFNRLLKRFHVPRPHIVEKAQGCRPSQREFSFFERLSHSLRSLSPLAHARAS